MKVRARRFLPVVVLLLGLAIVGVLALLETPPATDLPGSSSSAKPGGTLALYSWLGRSGYHVMRSSDAGLGLGSVVPARATLLVLAPYTDVPDDQAAAIERWVSAGGQAVLATDGSYGSVPLARLGIHVVSTSPEQVEIVQPLFHSPPVSHLAGETAAAATGLPPAAVGAVSASGAVVMAAPHGAGRFWVVAAPGLLDNAHIGREDNRKLLLNMVGPVGRTVVFDEFTAPPAAGSAAFNWLTDSAWGVAVLLALTLALLYRWLSGVRLGPAAVPLRADWRPASEYVVSMAGLMRRAGKRDDILGQYQQVLRRTMQGRSVDDTVTPAIRAERDAEVDRLLEPVSSLSEQQLIERAARIIECEEQWRNARD